MRKLYLIILILVLPVISAANQNNLAPQAPPQTSMTGSGHATKISTGPAQSSLYVQSVKFEPIGTGKSVVHVVVSDPTAVQKVFLINLQTDGRPSWDCQYTAVMKPGETRNIRCVFCINGPVTKDQSITLRFYEPVSAENWDDSQYFQQQIFNLNDLEVKLPAELKALPKSDIKAVQVTRAFKSFQRLIRQGNYGKIWDSTFSKDYQVAGFHSLDTFKNAMTDDLPTSTCFWDRDTLLDMHPASVDSSGDLIILSVTNGKETWQVEFIPSENCWSIDWIGGYQPAILQLPNQNDIVRLLLAKTLMFSTQHFEIHYFKNSTAERELSSIAQAKERAYDRIVESLGLPRNQKILFFLFEDMKAKFLDTGSIGLGFGGTVNGTPIMGEVYNRKQRCDAYHELTHVLTDGEPPAVLNEGVATYMSERLGGAHALRYLGGGDQALYAQVRDFKQKGEWIDLKELLSYSNIGSQGSRSVLAYVEAGAFVKYLIETYGKDQFIEAYKNLKKTDDPKVLQQNQQELERIYGCSLQKLEKDWERAFMSESR